MSELAGKRVLVIGGETAAGRALAVGLGEAGADVAVVSLTKARAAQFAINSALNELWAMGRRGLALPIDASDAAQVRDAVERAERELGRLDGAAAVADEGTPVALEALRAALPGREVIEVAADASAAEAVEAMRKRV